MMHVPCIRTRARMTIVGALLLHLAPAQNYRTLGMPGLVLIA